MSTPSDPDQSGIDPNPYLFKPNGAVPPAAPQPGHDAAPEASQLQPPPPHAGKPPYPPYPYLVPQRTNGLAIASMVLGIVWIYWIGSILALIFGYRARDQIRERNEGGEGMAMAGIVLGWVGVGVLAVLLLLGAAAQMASS